MTARVFETFKSVATVPRWTSCVGTAALESGRTGIAGETATFWVTSQWPDWVRRAKRACLSRVSVTKDGRAWTSGLLPPTELPAGVAGSKVRKTAQGSVDIIYLKAWNQEKGAAKGKKRVVEIWNDDGIVDAIDLSKEHGDFYDDDFFGGSALSSDGSKLAYVAQEKDEDENGDGSIGAKYAFKQDWGEKYSGKLKPVLCVLDLTTKRVNVLRSLPFHPGQVTFGLSDDELIVAGLETEPRLLGLRACFNRKCAIYSLKIDGTRLVSLTEQFGHARSPIVVSTRGSIIFLVKDITFPHNSCSALYEFSFATKSTRVVMDFIERPKTLFSFPGLFGDNFISAPLFKDFALININWRSQRSIVAVHLLSQNQVVCLTTEYPGAWTLLQVAQGYVLASYSQPNKPEVLMLGTLQNGFESLTVSWKSVTSYNACPLLQSIGWSIEILSETNEAIVLSPIGEKNASGPLPLVLYPHGGPHAGFASEYSAYPAALAALGYIVALVNYTGSTGFGQGSITDLVGKIGQKDVQDVHDVAKLLVTQGRVDPKRIVIAGGSHGGFLGVHLMAQFPDFYCAAALRNPVVDLTTMFGTTDIPDWCYLEAGIPYDLKTPPLANADTVVRMLAASPLAISDKIKGPILLLLGQDDRRVPMTQGVQLYHALRARGVESKILVFPENGHALDGFEADVVGFESMAEFFKRW